MLETTSHTLDHDCRIARTMIVILGLFNKPSKIISINLIEFDGPATTVSNGVYGGSW